MFLERVNWIEKWYMQKLHIPLGMVPLTGKLRLKKSGYIILM
jgi:hypothetical protein